MVERYRSGQQAPQALTRQCENTHLGADIMRLCCRTEGRKRRSRVSKDAAANIEQAMQYKPMQDRSEKTVNKLRRPEFDVTVILQNLSKYHY